MKHKNAWFVAGVTALVSLSSAFAHPPMPPHNGPAPHPGFGPPPPPFMLLSGVDLTATQRAQLDDIMRREGPATPRDMEHARMLDRQIVDVLLASGPVDMSKLNALVKEKDVMRAKLEASHIDLAVKLHDLLTPQQREKVRLRHEKIEKLHAELDALTGPGPADMGPPGAP